LITNGDHTTGTRQVGTARPAHPLTTMRQQACNLMITGIPTQSDGLTQNVILAWLCPRLRL